MVNALAAMAARIESTFVRRCRQNIRPMPNPIAGQAEQAGMMHDAQYVSLKDVRVGRQQPVIQLQKEEQRCDRAKEKHHHCMSGLRTWYLLAAAR